MQFSDEWVKEINGGNKRKLNRPQLELVYKNGFVGTADANKNDMTDWEVTGASGN